MNDKSKKIIMILDFISMVFSIGALVFFFNGGVGFENPIVWIMFLIVLSSISSLITQVLIKNRKKLTKKNK